jgi:hypothetical protein
VTTFLLQPWRLDTYTRPPRWSFHTKICVENLPLHAWSAEGVCHVLGDICVFDYMEATTFRQENTTIFSFFAWMKNPNILPRSKEVTFFLERAGRSNGRDGLPSVDAPLVVPPKGRDATLLIHLDHYYDWTPLPSSYASSEVSELPSSSGSTKSHPFPVFHNFALYPRCVGWTIGSVPGKPTHVPVVPSSSSSRPPERRSKR